MVPEEKWCVALSLVVWYTFMVCRSPSFLRAMMNCFFTATSSLYWLHHSLLVSWAMPSRQMVVSHGSMPKTRPPYFRASSAMGISDAPP